MSTPLASIFGSGFLVIVPILASVVGPWSPLVMAAVCAVAWCVGSTIRFNIRHVEPQLAGKAASSTRSLERSADLALVIAYIISVCLYLHILSAFLLAGLGMDSPFNENLLTTTVILLITIVGIVRGLELLEKLEVWSLAATVLIIALLIGGFAWYDFGVVGVSDWQWPQMPDRGGWEILTVVGGTLIVVQGFETPRYMGDTYSAAERIAASRRAQVVSSLVYVAFVALAVPVVPVLNGDFGDNSLIQLTTVAASVLVAPLIAAAVLSQFSAAVADTMAACGSLEEVTQGHLQARWAYFLVGAVAVALTWSADTYEVLALASRAFALYFLLQCLVAGSVVKSVAAHAAFGVLAVVLGFVMIFAVPAG
ncbi:MAG: hypothetical protein AAF574_00400 [Pseudomonadota bacterium]